jgi:hypothetical protein
LKRVHQPRLSLNPQTCPRPQSQAVGQKVHFDGRSSVTEARDVEGLSSRIGSPIPSRWRLRAV